MANSTMTWQDQVTDRFEIEPTFEAMQRCLYFGLRCTSVVVSEPLPGQFLTTVSQDGTEFSESGESIEESMANTLLSMPVGDFSL